MAEETQVLRGVDTSVNLEDALAARVKDPLWFLARQWQSGEFEAENGGRVAWIAATWREFLLEAITRDGARQPVSTDAPLEAAIEAEDAAGDSPAWRSEALEYRFDAHTAAHDLAVEAYDGRRLDWYHFDVSAHRSAAAADATGTRRITPTQMHIRGAPHPRWWRLEQAGAQLDAPKDPEPNALSMLLPEFLYLDINNWYVAPLPQTAGSVQEITRLEVVDSFGVVTELPPTMTGWSGSAWRLFTLTGEAPVTDQLSGRLLFVPNVAIDLLHNDEVEEVRFIRDEAANLAWAYERRYRDASGAAVLNGDRSADAPAPAPDGVDPLPRFRLRSDSPPHWVPYVPRYADPTAAIDGDVYLRRARSVESARLAAPQYKTKIVAESWRIDEHEVPRTGIRVRRVRRFARGSDGQAHHWVGRQKDTTDRGHLASLRFDYLVDPPT